MSKKRKHSERWHQRKVRQRDRDLDRKEWRVDWNGAVTPYDLVCCCRRGGNLSEKSRRNVGV